MFRRFKLSGWLICLTLLALVEAASFIGAAIVIATPAQAQYWGGRPSGGGFFGGWFGGGGGYYQRQQPREYREYREYETPAESAHAPPPRKMEVRPEQTMPTTNVVVAGDGMADWLAYGLEDAFADAPEVSILRKHKTFSGLLKYDPKTDLDWWHVARDILAQEKPSYVVMMLGVSDRQNIRERDLQKEAEKEAKEKEAKEAKEKEAKEQKAKEQAQKEPAKDAKDQKDAPKDQKDAKEQKPAEQEKSAETADSEAPPAEQQKTVERPKRNLNGVVEFRSEQWEKIYVKRIDETIAALKSKNVPVFWVGLPAIRGAKSTADTSYLNNLYRARAQRAGIVFIDVWDGFVDEEGKYTSYGPDYEGQQRRLRANDGVYFTKYGARKLAHYVEREIRRYMASRIVSLPSQTAVPAAVNGKPSERPVAGPVIPLALVPSTSDDQLAGGNTRPQGDPLALQVLVKGEPVNPQAGRADDFSWPQGGTQAPVAAVPAKAPGNEKAAPQSDANPPAALLTDEPAAQSATPAPAAPAKPKPQRAEAKPKPAQHNDAPRPPRDVPQQRGGLFGGIFR